MTLSVDNNQQTGIMVPTIATAAGAGAGSTFLAPAKYKSFEQLVSAAKDDVQFTAKTNDLTGDAKKAADTVKKALDKTQKKLEILNKKGLFPDGKANLDAVLKELNIDSSKLPQIGQKGTVAEALIKRVDDLAKGAIKVTDDMGIPKRTDGKFDAKAASAYLPDGFEFTKDGKQIQFKNIVDQAADTAEKPAKGASKVTKKPAKGTSEDAKTVAKGTSEGPKKVTKRGSKGTKKAVQGAAEGSEKAAKEAIRNALQGCIDARKANAPALQLLEKATKDGKVTQEAVEGFIKTATEEVQTAFDTIKKSLGKNRLIGAAIYGAIGLAAGLGIKAMISGKKDA